ncbi:porin [Paraburkholderia pallida]|uniref:Porin n=1 Tax=Paraburkholderia pallida TaxID=2547399 RepID=A0A4P7D309_9BURK|nr:porin [Paraburkholderia pallida]QBR01140.1 porin [Paraburkholderia pallida]
MRFVTKSICSAVLILAAGGASAQTSVTLYGVVDVFGQYLLNGSGTKGGPGTAYVPGANSFSERSGGSTGSMFGLKGSEDLGGGLKAIFDVENGFNVNNGTFFADSTTLFYRQSWVGLRHDDWGQLTFGRQYQPSFLAIYPTDPFRGNEVLSPIAATDLAGARDRATLATQYVSGRTSNAIAYQSPDWRGLRLYGMYAFSTTVTQPVQMTSGNMLDLAATYSGYGLYVGLAYQFQHAGQESASLGQYPSGTPLAGQPLPASTFDLVSTAHYSAALAYRIGIVNLQFNYSYNSPSDPPPGARVTAPGVGTLTPLAALVHPYSIIEAGATIQATSVDVIEIAGIYRSVRGVDDNTPGFEIGAEHFLSKRTSLYLRAGYMKNNGIANVSWPGVTAADGSKQVLAVLGMSHRF